MGGLIRIETRRLLRSARARWVSGLLFVATLVACGLGTLLTAQHQEASQADVVAANLRLDKLLSDEDNPRSLLEVALYSDTVIPRGVPALAALSAGDLDALPDAATVRLNEAPRLVPPRSQRSPASALLGTFDLAWLLALLMPLALLGLGHDSIAGDRSRGNLAMLLAFAPNPVGLVLARTFAIAAVATLGILPALVLGLGMACAHLESPPSAGALVGVLLLTLSGIWAWSAMMIAVSAHAARPGQALAAGLGLWATLTIILPLALSVLGQLSYPDPDPRAELEALQVSKDLAQEDAQRWVDQELARAPNLDPEDAIDGVESNLRFDLLLARAQVRRSRGARHASALALRRRAELARISAYLSPSTLVSHGLAALADTDPEARIRFSKRAGAYLSQLDKKAAAPLLKNSVARADLKDWPVFDSTPDRDTTPTGLGILLLNLVAAFSLVLAGLRLYRGPIDPSSESP